jgi:hypothetical protein
MSLDRTARSMAYCKACRVEQLAEFPGWSPGTLANDAIVFLHDDFVVSSDAARAHIVFKDLSLAWQAFATRVLAPASNLSAGKAAHSLPTAGLTTTHTGNQADV